MFRGLGWAGARSQGVRPRRRKPSGNRGAAAGQFVAEAIAAGRAEGAAPQAMGVMSGRRSPEKAGAAPRATWGYPLHQRHLLRPGSRGMIRGGHVLHTPAISVMLTSDHVVPCTSSPARPSCGISRRLFRQDQVIAQGRDLTSQMPVRTATSWAGLAEGQHADRQAAGDCDIPSTARRGTLPCRPATVKGTEGLVASTTRSRRDLSHRWQWRPGGDVGYPERRGRHRSGQPSSP